MKNIFSDLKSVLTANVVVAALGYFVDIYDLLLFGIVRVASLKSLGFVGDDLLEKGVLLINSQMLGMLFGGVLWGMLGDKKGRLSVLFGSIAMYSLANIANAFVTNVEMYALLRFLAGIGLAGELGAAITLVSETLPKEKRGYGTTVVASVGVLGAVAAALVGDLFDWKISYIIGGVMGLLLLFLRVRMHESGLFSAIKTTEAVKKGDFLMLFVCRKRFFRYLRCILIGIPLWYVVGILVTFSPELAVQLGVTETISAGRAIMFCYLGLSIGDLASGLVSQYLKSRVRAIWAFTIATLGVSVIYLTSYGLSAFWFYTICLGLGLGAGYWAVFVTTSAEQFGTNLRATVATSVPNFVRGSVVLLTFALQFFKSYFAEYSNALVLSAAVVGVISFGLAFLSLAKMHDSYSQDLDFHEVR